MKRFHVLIPCFVVAVAVAAASLWSQEQERTANSFAAEMFKLRLGWSVYSAEFSSKLSAEAKKFEVGSERWAGLAKWLKKNPPTFTAHSERLRKLVEANPKADELPEAFDWLFKNAQTTGDYDWAIDFIMNMEDASLSEQHMRQFLEADLRPRSTTALHELLAREKDEVLGVMQELVRWSLLQHFDARLRERMKWRAANPLAKQMNIERYGRSFVRSFCRESSSGDEAALSELMRMILEANRRNKKALVINGKGSVRWVRARQEHRERFAVGAHIASLKGRLTTSRPIEWPLGGKQVDVVVFWGPWDGKGKSALSFVRRLRKRYEASPVRVRLVATDCFGPATRSAMNKAKVYGDCLLDVDGDLAREWLVWDAPEVFVIDSGQKIRFRGRADSRVVWRLLDKLIAGLEK